MIISLTLSSRFSINKILSATLAPPRMARNGLKMVNNVTNTYVYKTVCGCAYWVAGINHKHQCSQAASIILLLFILLLLTYTSQNAKLIIVTFGVSKVKSNIRLQKVCYLSGSCRALAKYWSSFLRRKPLALCSKPSPIIELWALWAVPVWRHY